MYHQVLQLLANGQPQTIQQLTQRLNLSPMAVEQAIGTLIAYGVQFNRSTVYSYQLTEPLELLDYNCILRRLSTVTQQRLTRLEILEVIDSTNHYALDQPEMGGALVCLAEYQTAGRGRQGRQWISPYASGLCLSLKQHYIGLTESLGGLSIAIAVTVGQVLRTLGATDIGLKWPNDVMWRGRKLAGILLESRTMAAKTHVVAGIGINLKVSMLEMDRIDQPWIDLQTVVGHSISRNELAGCLIEQGLHTLASYPSIGLTPFLRDWQSLDVIYGLPVTLTMSAAYQDTGRRQSDQVKGIACGLDEDGALLLQVGNRIERYRYGEVSVR